jgi:hypothetical protein
MKEIFIELPICNQREMDLEWAPRACAICSLWMILKGHDPQFALSPEQLLQEGIAAGGYIQNVGWSHRAITELAGRHGLNMEYAQKFFYTSDEKEAGMDFIAERLGVGMPVIASIFHELNPAKGGHMVVVRGIKKFGGAIIGFDIQDPDPTWRGPRYFLNREEFVSGWRGGLIWPK